MTEVKGKRGIKMVDLEMNETEQVERIFQNYTIDSQMINMEKFMQPVLPPIKKRPNIPEYKTITGLDKSLLEEIRNVIISR